MIDGEQQFISELKQNIRHQRLRQQITLEYEHHIYEMKQELQKETVTYEQLTSRLGTPKEIAKLWQEEIQSTPNKMQWLFVVSNISIFLLGVLLTVSYHLFDFHWIDELWAIDTKIPFLIMIVYLLFWALLGYEIGREFGHRGRRLLRRTFIICILPNLLFMYLIVFKVLPYEWFDPLLNVPFIILCIMFTGLLYPISMLGYFWGRRASI